MFPELIEMIVNSNLEDFEESCVTLRHMLQNLELQNLELQNRVTQNYVTLRANNSKIIK